MLPSRRAQPKSAYVEESRKALGLEPVPEHQHVAGWLGDEAFADKRSDDGFPSDEELPSTLGASGRTANLVRMAGSSTERRTGSVHQPRLRRPHTHPLPPRRDGDDAKDDSDDSDDGVFMRPSRPSDPVRSRREQQEGRHGTIQPVHTDSESTRLPSPPMHGNRGPLHPGPALVPLSTTQRVDSATAQGELASPVSPTSKAARRRSLTDRRR